MSTQIFEEDSFKMKQLKKDNIILNENNHTYSLTDNPNIKFTSCTTFVEYFFQKFDSIGIANNLTANHPSYLGITPQSLVESWEKTAKEGTAVHKEIESFVKEGITLNHPKSRAAIEWLRKIDSSQFDILTETIIYSKEIEIAGTVDLILYDKRNDVISIYDWKTSRAIYLNSYGNKMGRKKVTSKLMDCNFIHYSLQLSLYQYIIEKYYNLKVNQLTLLHLTNSSVIPYKCTYMGSVIAEMLKYDRDKLAKETEGSLTKEYDNIWGYEPDDFIDTEPDSYIENEIY